MKTRTELLGTVGVDSGQLMVVDPELVDDGGTIFVKEPPEPEEGDYILDCLAGSGAVVLVGIVGSSSGLGSFDGSDAALSAIRADMDAQSFWPNVWLERERGGYDLLDPQTGDMVS